MQISILISLIIAILAVTFALQNPDTIVIKFLAWQSSGSMALILLVTFTFGFVSSVFIAVAAFLTKKFTFGQKKEDDLP